MKIFGKEKQLLLEMKYLIRNRFGNVRIALEANKNKFFLKYTFISYQHKIHSKCKKIESVGTSPTDGSYKEK